MYPTETVECWGCGEEFVVEEGNTEGMEPEEIFCSAQCEHEYHCDNNAARDYEVAAHGGYIFYREA